MSAGRLATAALLLSLTTTSAGAATLFDPLLRFRVIRTEHFRIYFHQDADRLAARLATIAEESWRTLERPLGIRPPALTHVVLADQTELPNGYAMLFPQDTIVMFPSWPLGSEFDVDDWLRLLFTHEFTHILHLDRSVGWARALRTVFGRTPLVFPNIFLPPWQVEGLATYEESAMTGEGRLHAGEFRAIVGEAARHNALEPLDRVNGGLTDWPGGAAQYAYGAPFHDYLARRFGADKLAALADATAGRVPYTSSRVFRRIFGSSLGDLWRDFQSAQTANAGPSALPGLDSGISRITHQGFEVFAPRFDRNRCADCPQQIVYTHVSPHGFPALKRVDLRGGDSTRLATRYFGTTTGTGPGGNAALYFDQLEIHRNVALSGDLYELSRDNGRVRRLTWGARLHDPDLSPDGTTIACVQERVSERALVLVRLKADTTNAAAVVSAFRRTLAIDDLISERDTQFNAPRWSPDGRSIAVERHRLGFDPDVVVIDVAARTIRIAAAVPGMRIGLPAWRPDGRAIVVALAPRDQPFNLYEFPLDDPAAGRQLTHTTGGATWPDVSPDGRTIIFAGYTPDGYDVFSMPYPAGNDSNQRLPATARTAPLPNEPPPFDASPYSPLGTLQPTYWQPIVEWDNDQVRVGAATDGRDVLGYHQYQAAATWLASAPDGAHKPAAATPDWYVAYAYDRWRPTLFASASSEISFFAGPATEAGTPSSATRRERQIEGGVLLPIARTRVRHTALLALLRSADDYTLTDRSLSRNRTAIRAAWQTISARRYGYSISPEDGVAAGVTAEFIRRSLGASADATIVTTDLRAYVPGLVRHHVIALRGAAGVSRGDPIVGRTFVLGGPGGDDSVIDFGSGAISLLRAFGSNSFAGSHVALANAEYRLPLARPQRGVGTWPVFLHTIHAAAFADVGHAWTRRFDAAALKMSIGGELAARIVAGYYFPFSAAAGVAWGRDGSGTLPNRTTAYFRVGVAF